jgi:hypothetical protein
MFMHDRPLAAYLAQTNGQTELESGSFSFWLCTRTPHEGGDVRNVTARGVVHFIEIEDNGIVAPGEEEILRIPVRVDSLRL